MATLLGIAVKPEPRQPMQTRHSAVLSPAQGLHGDCRGKPGRRQITLMSQAAWAVACQALAATGTADLFADRELFDDTERFDEAGLPWLTRRANLLVDELPLYQSIGAHIVLGEAVLEVTGETDPCQRMEAACPGLFDALRPDWRGGVTCRVLRGGEIAVGMAVAWLANAEEKLR